jgi:hypothetical protein
MDVKKDIAELVVMAARIYEEEGNNIYRGFRDEMEGLLKKKGVMRALCNQLIAEWPKETWLTVVFKVMPYGKYGAYHVNGRGVSANRVRLFSMKGRHGPVFGDVMPSWRAGKVQRRRRAEEKDRAAAEIREILWDLPLDTLTHAVVVGGLDGEWGGYKFSHGEDGGTARKDGVNFGTGRAIKQVLAKRLEMMKPQPGLKVSMRECLRK